MVTDADVLRTLLKHNFMTCAQLGEELWCGGRGAGLPPLRTSRATNCSCPFARPAGRLVHRLMARGLVRRKRVDRDHRTFYEATPKGEREYTRLTSALRAAEGR